ncbi:MAG: cytochrome c [Ilumatobacteraceae bacterium]
MLAISTTPMAFIILLVIAVGFIVYAISNRKASSPELGSEIELAANRKPYYDDEVLEGRRLERVQFIGLLFLIVSVVGLPLYWILEPSRQAGAQEHSDNRAIGWGKELFAPTSEGGFNCAGCHGGMTGSGGVAVWANTDPKTNLVTSVNWFAPALNTVLYRFSEDEVRFILVYGRPFSPMSPWGLDGGGPMNAQQINNLIAYLTSIQVDRAGCAANATSTKTCDGGTLPAETQDEITAAAQLTVDNKKYASLGEALFNLDMASGAYSCARCHTTGWSYGDPGVSGGGAMGPSLTSGAAIIKFPVESDMISFISAGSEIGKKYGLQSQGSGRMPGFGAMLTDEQIKLIVEYVRGL